MKLLIHNIPTAVCKWCRQPVGSHAPGCLGAGYRRAEDECPHERNGGYAGCAVCQYDRLNEDCPNCAGKYHVCSCVRASACVNGKLVVGEPAPPGKPAALSVPAEPEPPTFKPGDRVRCVNADNCVGITVGNEYVVEKVGEYGPHVRGDDGDVGECMAHRFVLADAEPEGADREGWEREGCSAGHRYVYKTGGVRHGCVTPKGTYALWSSGAAGTVFEPGPRPLLEAQQAVERAVREAEQPSQTDHDPAADHAKPFALGVSPKMLARLMRKRYGAHTPCGGSSFMQHDWGFDYESSTCKRCGAHWRDVE